MDATQVPNLIPALGEIVLVCAAMALLLFGVWRGDRSMRTVAWLSVAALVVALLLVNAGPALRVVTMGGMFVADGFAAFMKTLVLLGSAFSIMLSLTYLEREQVARFEYPVLVLFATLGMMLMISANDLMALYLGLELQSLSLYVLAAFRRDSVRSTEAGLKYFVLGALASGMLLYGASLVYGFAGTTSFDALATLMASDTRAPIGVIVGLVFVVAGLAFKVSAVPFHMWTPDVYEGAPTAVTAFFAVAPKVAAVALFVRVMMEPFGPLFQQWQQLVVFISLASMIVGAFAALNQTNIKRLMAYSSIGHVGYALIGLAAGTEAGIRGVIIYMTLYMVVSLGTFACILCMRQRGRMVEGIDDLAGLSRTNPLLALAMGIFMFSMAGIPPLAGFFAKVYVFLAAIEAGLYTLAVIGVLSSVVAAYYYLRIVKLMYFDDPVEAFDRPIEREVSAILVGTGAFNLLFFAYPAPILAAAGVAAAALLG